MHQVGSRQALKASVGGYRHWACIDYQPAIAELLPLVVPAHLPAGSTALDVGCNKGGVSLFLAQHGLNVLGIDINPAAIEEARFRATRTVIPGSIDFRVADILVDPPPGPFDIVLLVRVLTCFPEVAAWETLLKRAETLIGRQGYIYIHDFVLSPENENYRSRYEAGARLGWRHGNFSVKTSTGELLFIAHHHSEEEVAAIVSPYQRVHLSMHESLSMNGNACRMFEFLGRRTE